MLNSTMNLMPHRACSSRHRRKQVEVSTSRLIIAIWSIWLTLVHAIFPLSIALRAVFKSDAG